MTDPQWFFLDAKNALQIQKTRITIATRIYSAMVERRIRDHPKYAELRAMRKNKKADRAETEKLKKKLLTEQLATEGITQEQFTEAFEQQKKKYQPYRLILDVEKESFKQLQPQVDEIPIYANWLSGIKGIGLNYSVKLINGIRDIERFENPSKLRKYCGTAPGMKKTRGQEAHFNPELKGVLLGQIAENFIKNRSEYKQLYDEKKTELLQQHPEALTPLTERLKGKTLKKGELRELWTKQKIHNYAKKAMINYFLVDLWRAWWLSKGKEPPRNPYIANIPGHTLKPMIVPYPAPNSQTRHENQDLAASQTKDENQGFNASQFIYENHPLNANSHIANENHRPNASQRVSENQSFVASQKKDENQNQRASQKRAENQNQRASQKAFGNQHANASQRAIENHDEYARHASQDVKEKIP